MQAERIERIKDMLLERRIVSEAGGHGFWQSRDKYLQMVEQVYNEPSEHSVRSLMDRFWESWQELSVRPGEMGARKAVLQRGETLVDAIHSRFERFKGIRDMLDDDIVGTVGQVNDMARQIAALNEQITKVKAMGDNPNDLMDRRDLLINRLSELVDVTVDDRDPDEYTVHTAGYILVQGKEYQQLDAVADGRNEGYARILWAGGPREMFFRGGRLAALIDLRDGDVRDEIQKLDTMTVNFVDLVNEIHREGYGSARQRGHDFFVEVPFVDNPLGDYDANGDGTFDSTRLFRLSGTNRLDPKAQIGLRGALTLAGPVEPVRVEYFPTDTVEDLLERVNRSGAEVERQARPPGPPHACGPLPLPMAPTRTSCCGPCRTTASCWSATRACCRHRGPKAATTGPRRARPPASPAAPPLRWLPSRIPPGGSASTRLSRPTPGAWPLRSTRPWAGPATAPPPSP